MLKLLDESCSSQSFHKNPVESKAELKKRLDSKSPLGDYFSKLFEVAGYHVCNKMVVKLLLSHVVGVSSMSIVVVDILAAVAKGSPEVLTLIIVLHNSFNP